MSKRIMLVVLTLGLTFSLACKSELDGKTSATVSEPAAVEAAPEAAPEAAEEAPTTREIAVDTSTSKLEWLGAKVTGDHKGGFKDWTGKAVVDANNALKSLSFDVDVASLHSDSERLEGHLRSEDFFHVEEHPKATFASTTIAEGGEGDATHTVTGNLMLRGVTKQISFPATVKADEGKVVAMSEFKINRMDFGIAYKGMADDLIREEVLLTIHLEVPVS